MRLEWLLYTRDGVRRAGLGSNGHKLKMGAMKAIVQEGVGSADVLYLRELEKPAVGDDTVLVRVRAASLNALDWHTLHGGRLLRVIAWVMRAPSTRVRGADLAGDVEAVGRNVTGLRPGDEVFGTAPGTLAEYVDARERNLGPKPRGLSFTEAAALPVAGISALQGLRDKGQVKAGQRVLINGAGGGVGTLSVQIAKALGAHVTAVTATRNVPLVASLGPDRTIDRSEHDFTGDAEQYDVIFDVAADRPLSRLARALKPDGRIVLVGAAKSSRVAVFARLFEAIVRSKFGSRKFIPFLAKVTSEDLLALGELIHAGKLRPIIEREYTLSEAAEAMRYLGTGQARAKLVITLPEPRSG
jgi:NADPH:quinone reductase-like Zn-dependent oxidoreductase